MESPVERELRLQRRRLLYHEQKTAAEISRTYRAVYIRLKKEFAELQRHIAKEVAAGGETKVSWLVKQDQFTKLIADMEREAFAFGRQASEIIANGQQFTLSDVNAHQWSLTEAMLGTPPSQAALATIEQSFISLNPGALQRFVGIASDGQPLGLLLDEIAPHAAKKAAQTIAYGIAKGSHPTVVAREFRKVASIPLNRALTISRTEMLRAYTSAALENYKLNGDVVVGWYWHAELDIRTCSSCWMQSGSEHGPDETMDKHPRCRCTCMPKTKTWEELGFPGIKDTATRPQLGADVFEQLPDADKRLILGPGKFDAYKSGEIGLKDLSAKSHSERWGTMNREASLKEARASAAA